MGPGTEMFLNADGRLTEMGLIVGLVVVGLIIAWLFRSLASRLWA